MNQEGLKMSLSGIKTITTLAGSRFYLKIMQKYQTGKKSTSKFPTMIYYKEKGHLFPQRISIVLKFSLHLNQQNIAPVLILKKPVLILKNLHTIEERLSGPKTDKKELRSILELKDIQSTNNLTEIYQAAFRSLQGRHISKFYLTGNTPTNKFSVFSILKSLSSVIDKGSTLKCWHTLENKLSSTFLREQIIIPYLIMKNILTAKGLLPRLSTERKGMQLLVKQENALNINDITNIFSSQEQSRVQQRFHAGLNIFRHGDLAINPYKILNLQFRPVHILFNQQKTYVISSDSPTVDPKELSYESNVEILNLQIFGKTIYSRLLNASRNFTFINGENRLNCCPAFEYKLTSSHSGKENIKLSLNVKSSLIAKNVLLLKENLSGLKYEKGYLQSLFQPKNPPSIPSINGNIPTDKLSVFSAIKSLIFKTGNIVTDSNRISKLLSLSENSINYQMGFNSIFPGSKQVSSQVFRYNNNVISSSHMLGMNKIYRSLNINMNSAFINKINTSKNWLVFNNKLLAFLLHKLTFNKTSDASKYFFKKQNRANVARRLIKNSYGDSEYEADTFVQSKHNYKIRNENLVFRDQKRVEQEIEQIKKTLIETKKSVSEKTIPVFGESDIKKYLDINRISSQVYQNIERTIRMERERRGA